MGELDEIVDEVWDCIGKNVVKVTDSMIQVENKDEVADSTDVCIMHASFDSAIRKVKV